MAVILVIFAALFNAIMDRVETTISFNDSVFNKLNPLWWCKAQSADVVKKIPFTAYKPDCWHLSKSAMICLLLAIPFFYKPIIGGFIDYVLLGILYNIVFEQFYSKILKKKALKQNK
jgi:hypothetical protein